jgi:hypothetical protein
MGTRYRAARAVLAGVITAGACGGCGDSDAPPQGVAGSDGTDGTDGGMMQSGTATDDGADGEVATTGGPGDDGVDVTTGGDGDSGSGDDAGELGPPMSIPISGYCPVDGGEGPPSNPDLTRTLPGTTWDAASGCITDGYYWNWPHVVVNGVEGEMTVRFAFDDSPTLDMLVDLSYTEQIEIDRASYSTPPEDCDEMLHQLLGTSTLYTTTPLHQGYVHEASSCVALEGTVCGCELVTHYVEERDNAGYIYLDDNVGVQLSDEKELVLYLTDDAMSVELWDNGTAGQVEAWQGTVELAAP